MLKPFQHEGAQFLAQRTRALLADEPGVGKTAQFITACNLVGARRVGIVCPSIGTEHWRREIEKWNFKGDRADIISWGDAHKVRDAIWKTTTGVHWDVLIPDESHFGKNPHAQRARAVFGTQGLGWFARRIWAGSGTPTPNGNAAELWPLLRAFGKTKMDLATFTNYFCVVDSMGKIRGNRPDHVEELRAIIVNVALRRLKKDVLPELGEIDVQEWFVKPRRDFVVGNLHEATHREAQLRAELHGKSDDEILAFLSDSTQDFSTLRRYNALLKAPAVFETVKFELENGLLDKVVIYGHHVEAMQALHEQFRRANIPSTLIIGETPREARDPMIEDWKRKGKVLIASTIIASTALDFSAAHQGIMLELGWLPGENSQAIQRMHRHGQTQPVTVRVAMGSEIDEIINAVILRKIKDTKALLDGGGEGVRAEIP